MKLSICCTSKEKLIQVKGKTWSRWRSSLCNFPLILLNTEVRPVSLYLYALKLSVLNSFGDEFFGTTAWRCTKSTSGWCASLKKVKFFKVYLKLRTYLSLTPSSSSSSTSSSCSSSSACRTCHWTGYEQVFKKCLKRSLMRILLKIYILLECILKRKGNGFKRFTKDQKRESYLLPSDLSSDI